MSYFKQKADFNHKIGIKIYMISTTLLCVKFFPQLISLDWYYYALILFLSYSYCIKRAFMN